MTHDILILFFLFFLFLIIVLLSTFFSTIPIISFSFLYEFSFLFLLSVITVVVANIFGPVDFLKELSFLFIIIGFIFSIPIFVTFLQGYEKPLSFTGSNVTTRLVFFGFISSIYKYTSTKNNIYFISSLVLFLSIILVGSRGGLLATILCIILYLLLNIKKIKPKNNYRIISLFLLVILIAAPFLEDVFTFFSTRFIDTTFQDGQIYTAGRDTLYGIGLNLFEKNPIFGSDLGMFFLRTNMHPHNLVLELAIDFGILGIIFFAIVLFSSFILIIELKNTRYFALSYIPIYMILVHMFSGSYYDFRYFFLWIIPLILLNNRKDCTVK